MVPLAYGQLEELCRQAASAAGAGSTDADTLARATAEAEFGGRSPVGVGHLFDYLDGYRQGRIVGAAEIQVDHTAPSLVAVDAGGGLAQSAFEAARVTFVAAVHASGLAALWVNNAFTCGELGYYARHLALDGLIAVAAANSPALMSVGGATEPVLGTNPLAYAVPRPGQLPIVVDQASTETAFVSIRRAAEEGRSLPPGWALDVNGRPTEDARQALLGSLLPFGGHKGGNIALLVELLATLSGASFSLDAPAFDRGGESPGTGLFVLGLDASRFPGAIERLRGQLDRLRDDFGVRVPGLTRTEYSASVSLDPALHRRLLAAAVTRT